MHRSDECLILCRGQTNVFFKQRSDLYMYLVRQKTNIRSDKSSSDLCCGRTKVSFYVQVRQMSCFMYGQNLCCGRTNVVVGQMLGWTNVEAEKCWVGKMLRQDKCRVGQMLKRKNVGSEKCWVGQMLGRTNVGSDKCRSDLC